MKKYLSIILVLCLFLFGFTYRAYFGLLIDSVNGLRYDQDGDGTPEFTIDDGAVTMGSAVVHDTDGATVYFATQSNGIFTNSGATTDVTFSISEACSAAYEGKKLRFIVTDTTYEMYVDANAADQFRGMYSTNANGDKLSGDQVEGSMLCVECIKDDAGTYRLFTSGMGDWTDAD